jgi:peptide/nickel transport system permease protein
MTANAANGVTSLAKPRGESVTLRTVRRFRRHRLAVIALGMLVVIVLMAIFADVLTRFPYEQVDLRARSSPPSAEHWFGTDRVGRDVWSRMVYGARVSLAVGLGATALSSVIGVIVGSVAGFYGKWVDMLLMRITDVVLTFPSIVIMLTLAALLPRTIWAIVFVIGILGWPAVARLVRAQFLSLKEQEYVLAARSIGVSNTRIMFVHILPNVIAPLVALVTFSIGSAILTEAGLSFLGLGVPPPTPSWGNMLETARNLDILRNLPWTWIPPAVMTVVTLLCVNFIGDGIRDAVDPRLVL